MGRSPCDSGLKKGPWTPEEDDKLMHYIQKHGHGSWRALPKLAGLTRCGKSCGLRWTNYLRPDVKRGKFSQEEEQTILNLHAILGNKWSAIATHLPGRTDNEIKNFWNTHLKKELIQTGFDPMTHQPRSNIFSSLPSLIALANLKELKDDPPMARLNQFLQHFLRPPKILQNYATIQELSAFTVSNVNNTSVSRHLQTALPPPPPPPPPPPSLVTENSHDSTVFSRLPGLQGGDCSDFTAVLSQRVNSASSAWMQETCIASMGDECSHGGGAKIRSELLDDPIFRDIA